MSDNSNIDSIFCSAIEIESPEERDSYVQRACGDDKQFRGKVSRLLNAHFHGGSILDSPANDLVATIDLPIADGPGTVIGSYKLLERIGEGGMGVVFLAEQERPVHRKVALKVIKPGMDTRQVIGRFEAERQALAMMDHSNIAKVYAAGATENGRPYFVMELVQGIPITEYCDQCNITTRERLELFISVCQAVQHAHQKGIIHRDLKPTNVLVAMQDGRPAPRIIDFGVAKAIDQRLTEHTLTTNFAQMIGTPQYMSPEQAELSPLGVDTRSDIYSLGVLLYELLTGNTPFDKDRLHSAPFDELRRIIREEEPPRPSARISTLAADLATTVAERRRTDARRLGQAVRGELDWIVMKCLEKDRNRRYESAGSLAQDIERFLRDEPVQACSPSVGYRLSKFVCRNKAAVLAVSAVTLAMAVGLALASFGLVRARTEAVRSEHVAQFLKDMLAAAGPSVARGRDATLLREILDQTANRVENDLAGDPLIQSDLWYTLGNTYAGIGDIPRAITMFQRAVESYRMSPGGDSTKLALAMVRLGANQSFKGDVATGKANAQLGLQIARKCEDPKVLATCLTNMATSCYASGYASTDSEPYVREALALYKHLGNEPVAVANCMHHLAICEIDTDEAQNLELQALETHRKYLGLDHPQIALDLQGLGELLLKVGKVDEAESILLQSLDLYRKIQPNHPNRVTVLRFVVQALALRGKWEQAEAVIQEELQASTSNPMNPRYLILLGAVKATQGDWSAAVGPFSRAVEMTPPGYVDCDECWFNLAVAHLRSGNKEEYRRHCHEFLTRPGIQAVMASLLLPVDVADLDRACELADSGALDVSRYPPWQALAKALAELRRNRFASAKEWAERVITAESSPLYKASACYVQAIADVGLHQLESAREAFAKGDRLGDPAHHIAIPGFFDLHDWTVADSLRREAIELIGSAKPHSLTVPKDQSDESHVQPTNDNPTPITTLNPQP